MRPVTLAVANSLDNFIAREDGSIDWLLWSTDARQLLADFWKRQDTALMGRKTWEATFELGGATGSPESTTRTFVFSRTLGALDDPTAELVTADAHDFVRKLKQADGEGICLMGGGELARSLFEADLVDEIALNVHPVLLGSGVPLFHRLAQQIDLELLESRPIAQGCLWLRYAVRR